MKEWIKIGCQVMLKMIGVTGFLVVSPFLNIVMLILQLSKYVAVLALLSTLFFKSWGDSLYVFGIICVLQFLVVCVGVVYHMMSLTLGVDTDE